MKTNITINNNTANYIATKGVAKHMDRSAAVQLWSTLKHEGWSPAGNTLQKTNKTSEGEFTFVKLGANKIVVSYNELEVAL